MDSVPDIVDAVLIFLGLLSVVVWSVAIMKFIYFLRNAKYDRDFLAIFSGIKTMQELERTTSLAKGRLAKVCLAGLDEIATWKTLAPWITDEQRHEMLQQALKQQSYIEQIRMENGLSILASIGSTAPFIGLFGTVWGIMNALKNISEMGSASLDVVSGPIGEALIATAIGIATAVPAVLAYNYYLRKVRLSVATMDNFASAFHLVMLKLRSKSYLDM